MKSIPIAVLRFNWPGQESRKRKWSLAEAKKVFESTDIWWSAPSYWLSTSHGTISLVGSKVFECGTISIPFFSNPNATPPAGQDRQVVCSTALADARARRIDLSGFQGFVVLFSEPPGGMGADAGAVGTAALLYEANPDGTTDPLGADFYYHEIGHVIGFNDAFGVPSDPRLSPQKYLDPGCVMSAQIYNNTSASFEIPNDATCPNLGKTGFFKAFPPNISRSALNNLISEFSSSPRVVSLPETFRASSVVRRIFSVDWSGPGATLIVAPKINPTDPSEFQYSFEYKPSKDWDRGVDIPGLVMHKSRDRVDGDALSFVCSVYEGTVPVPMIYGDSDIWDLYGNILARVIKAASDFSYIDVRFSDYNRVPRGVTINASDPVYDPPTDIDSGVAERVKIEPACGYDSFKYRIYDRGCTFSLSPVSFGYAKPTFTWRINGVAVPEIEPSTLTVDVESTVYGAATQTKKFMRVTLECRRSNAILSVVVPANAKECELFVEVTVSESARGELLWSVFDRKSSTNVTVLNEVREYEERFAVATRNCWEKFTLDWLEIPRLMLDPEDPRVVFERIAIKSIVSRILEWSDFRGVGALKKMIVETGQDEPQLALQLMTGLNILSKIASTKRVAIEHSLSGKPEQLLTKGFGDSALN